MYKLISITIISVGLWQVLEKILKIDPFLKALAEKEEANRSGKMTVRDK